MDARRRILNQLNEYPDFLTVEEVRQVLNLSKNSAYEAIKRGDIPSVKLGPRLTRVSKAALIGVMNAGTHPAKDPR